MISFKRGLRNLFLVSIYSFIFFIGLRVQDYFLSEVSHTFKPLPLIIYQTIFPIVFGFLLVWIPPFNTTILTNLLFLGNTFKIMALGFGIVFGYTLLGSFHKEVENIAHASP